MQKDKPITEISKSEETIRNDIFQELYGGTGLVVELIEIILKYILCPFDSFKGICIKKIGTRGTEISNFLVPSTIVSDEKCVYISDSFNNRTQVLDIEGNFIRQWSNNHPYIHGGKYYTSTVMDMVIYESQLYVTDYTKLQILIFSFPDGHFVRKIPCYHKCYGIFIDKGLIYLTCPDENAISIYETDGRFVSSWLCKGKYDYYRFRPHSICILQNKIFISERYSNFLVCYSTNGEFNYICPFPEVDPECAFPTAIKLQSIGEYLYLNHKLGIFKFDENGKFVKNIKCEGTKNLSSFAFLGNKCFITSWHDHCVYIFK